MKTVGQSINLKIKYFNVQACDEFKWSFIVDVNEECLDQLTIQSGSLNYGFWICRRVLKNRFNKTKRTHNIWKFEWIFENYLWRTLWAYPNGGYTIGLVIVRMTGKNFQYSDHPVALTFFNEWMNEWMNESFIFLLSMNTFVMRNNFLTNTR